MAVADGRAAPNVAAAALTGTVRPPVQQSAGARGGHAGNGRDNGGSRGGGVEAAAGCAGLGVGRNGFSTASVANGDGADVAIDGSRAEAGVSEASRTRGRACRESAARSIIWRANRTPPKYGAGVSASGRAVAAVIIGSAIGGGATRRVVVKMSVVNL